MSAYVVEDDHINALVTYAAEKRISYYDPIAENRIDINGLNTTAIGKILLAENVRSVNYRYHETDTPDDYSYRHFATPLTAIEVIKACDCLDYQSCETPDWDQTVAWRILQAIKSHAMHDLPGYDSAPWGISERTIGKLKHAGRVNLLSLVR